MSENVCSTKRPPLFRPYCFSLPDRAPRHLIEPDDVDPVYYDACHTCDHFEACQEANEHKPRILTLHLKEVFFRRIQRGEKLHEYREFNNDYWNKRILHGRYDVIEICNAYPARGDLNNRMWFRWNGWQTIMEYHDPVTGVFIPEGKQYFSISLEKPIAYPYQAMEAAHV